MGVWAVEGEERYLHLDGLSSFGFHLVGPRHEARGCRERCAGCVFERIPRLEGGLLADNAGAAHFLHLSVTVGDFPMPGLEGDRGVREIFDGDGIGPNEITLVRLGLVFEKVGPDGNPNIVSSALVHGCGILYD